MSARDPKRRLSTRQKSEINVTPLIDVLLVLIVIFMVISPANQKGFETQVPQPSTSRLESKRPDTLILSLDRLGTIRLNQETLEPDAVFSRLRDVFSTRADRTLFLQADREVLFNEVAQLIDTARGAGADRVGLMTTHLTAQ